MGTHGQSNRTGKSKRFMLAAMSPYLSWQVGFNAIPFTGTFANSENLDEMFAETELIFTEINTIYFLMKL